MKKLLLSEFKVQVYFIVLLILFIVCYGSRVTKADNGCDIRQKKRTSYKHYVRKHYKHTKVIVFTGNASNTIALGEIMHAHIVSSNPKFR